MSVNVTRLTPITTGIAASSRRTRYFQSTAGVRTQRPSETQTWFSQGRP